MVTHYTLRAIVGFLRSSPFFRTLLADRRGLNKVPRTELAALRNMRNIALCCLTLILWTGGCQKVAPGPPRFEFDFHRVERSLPGCGDAVKRQQPCVTFQAVWKTVKSGPPEVQQLINDQIVSRLHPPPPRPQDFDQEAAEFVASYGKFKAEYPKVEQTWFSRRNADVVWNDGHVLTIEIEVAEFNGGAYPLLASQLLVFRASDGRLLRIQDVLKESGQAEFNQLAESQLRRDWGIPPDRSLWESGIDLRGRRFCDSSNFGVSDRGIRLHFVSGEITPPTIGAVDILLPWERLRPLLQPGSPVAPVAGL